MYQQITIIGRVGQDPKVTYTQGGDAIASFSVATSERFQRNGEWQEKTTWHNVKAWRKQAEWAQGLQKGDMVVVVGKINVNKWEDRDGNKKTTVEITPSLILLASFPAAGGGPAPAPQNQGGGVADEDVPF